MTRPVQRKEDVDDVKKLGHPQFWSKKSALIWGENRIILDYFGSVNLGPFFFLRKTGKTLVTEMRKYINPQ